MNRSIGKPFVLIVEGQDDQAVIELLLRHLNLDRVDVINAEGKDKIRGLVKALGSAEGFDRVVRLAIVRDADSDPDAARRSCEDCLAATRKPSVSFLLPGDGPGMLEDLCLRTLQGRKDLRCVDEFVACMKEAGVTVRNESKFRMRGLLTALDDGKNRDTSWAAGVGLLDPSHPAFANLRQFLLDFTCA